MGCIFRKIWHFFTKKWQNFVKFWSKTKTLRLQTLMKILTKFDQKLHDVEQDFDKKPFPVGISIRFCCNKRHCFASTGCIFRKICIFFTKKWQNFVKFWSKTKTLRLQTLLKILTNLMKNCMMLSKILTINHFMQ